MRPLKQIIKHSLKKICGSAILWKHFCRVSDEPQVIVLGFHDVCEDRNLTSWLRMPKSRFVSFLADLRRDCLFIGPEALFNREALSRSRLNLLVTFDDGFANNHRLAMPVLRSFGIPALFFISSANIQQQSLFWFDRLIIPIQALNLRCLDLSSVGLNRYTFAPSSDAMRRWDTIQRLLVDVKTLGNPDEPPVQKVLSYISRQFHREIDDWREDFRPMTYRELGELAREPLFEIGSHSHHHQILTRLTKENLIDNLKTSKQVLEDIAHKKVDQFAPPNGSSNVTVKAQIEQAGYRFSYSVHAGTVSEATDPFNIPRLLIGGYDDIHDIRWKIAKTIFTSAGFRKG